MSIHPDQGSLYDDQGVDSFHKPHRPLNGLYTGIKDENSKLLYSDRLTTPDTIGLSTPDVTSFLSGVGSSLITSQAPTPSNFLRGEAVSSEQEMYARGFLEALSSYEMSDSTTGGNRQPEAMPPGGANHLKLVSSSSRMDRAVVHHPQTQALPSTAPFISGGPNPSLEAVAPTYVNATMEYIPSLAPPSHSEPSSVYASAHSYVSTYTPPVINHFTPMMDYNGFSSTTQQVTNHSQTSSTLPSHMIKELQRVVPADIKTQEHMKVERKKARNRIAASKCRLRRLQRESDLQGKVRVLKEHNQELNNEVSGLKLQINNLKKALIQHMKGGCQVNLPEGYGLRNGSTAE